jgi:hypothetical protein
LVTVIERTTRKQAAELLMLAGLSSYMGLKITEYIQAERAARDRNKKIIRTRFAMALRRYTK